MTKKPSHPNDRYIRVDNVIPIKNTLQLRVEKASEVEIKKTQWLVDDYIPLQCVTLMAGRGGIGKSQLLLWIASIVSRGSEFILNGKKYKAKKGNVFILSAEDKSSTSIVPRLIAAGADLDKIFIVSSCLQDDDKKTARFLSLDHDLKMIEEKITETGDTKLLIIDPITAYTGNIRENNSCEVRNFILKLDMFADKHCLSVFANTHTRKRAIGDSPGAAADEVMGSSAWVNTPRKVFTVAMDPDDERESRILVHNPKSNEGPRADAFDFEIEPHDIGGGHITSRIRLLNGKVSISADEAANPGGSEKRQAIEEAKKFILDQLKFGRRTSKEIHKEAEMLEINSATLKIARQRLTKEGTPIIMEKSQLDAREYIWYIGV